jgi:hypothetical protein
MTPQAANAKVYGDKGIVELGGLSDLHSNAILDRGAIIGLWEYDSEAASIVWATFVPGDNPTRRNSSNRRLHPRATRRCPFVQPG